MNMYAIAWMQLQMLVSYANKRTGRLVGDRGEGVISTAIAVLITAFLGAAMWVGFNSDLERCRRQHHRSSEIDREVKAGALNPSQQFNPRAGRERGAGLVGTSAGFLVFMLMMLAAVQILFNLYATSMVTAAAHDAARDVAGIRRGGGSLRGSGRGRSIVCSFARRLRRSRSRHSAVDLQQPQPGESQSGGPTSHRSFPLDSARCRH